MINIGGTVTTIDLVSIEAWVTGEVKRLHSFLAAWKAGQAADPAHHALDLTDDEWRETFTAYVAAR